MAKKLCAFLIVEFLWLAMAHSSGASERQFIKIDDTIHALPPASSDLPEQLQGVFWMDQGGHYGHSDTVVSLASAPDLAFTFGDNFDKKTRTVIVDITGPGWQWMNNAKGFLFASALGGLKFEYHVTFNEDYTYGQIVPTVAILGTRIFVPSWLVSFGFELQAPHSPCPPLEGSSKTDIVHCANWKRPSTGLLMKPFGAFGVFDYYMWRIADGNGHKPIQPYYDIFLKYAKSTDEPPTTLASMLSIDLGKGKEADMSFVVLPSSAKFPKTGGKSEL